MNFEGVFRTAPAIPGLLTMHTKSHKCKKCQKYFQTKYNLDTHFENYHKRQVDTETGERTNPLKYTKLYCMEIFYPYLGPDFNTFELLV